uniref:serine hydrolase n=1 Tax=Agathobacter sp. TaxID=2021311 RepID=UPI0040257804
MDTLKRVSPEEAGIHSQSIIEFIQQAQAEGIELHSLMILRHGKVCEEAWWKPYDSVTPQTMFSFSKSITSTAVGFAVQEGLLSLDEKLVDIFPD